MVNPIIIYYVIWVSIYLIYTLGLLFEWDDIVAYGPYLLWGIFWLAVAALLVTIFLSILYMRGYPFERLSGRGLLIVGVILLIFVLGVLFFQRWSWNQTYQSIRDKSRRRFYRTLDYEYGRNSRDLARRFQIHQSAVLNRVAPETLSELWEKLMVEDPSQVSNLLSEILGTTVTDPIDVQSNLLWYLCIATNPLQTGLSRSEIRYVLSLDQTTLERLVREGARPGGPDYAGLTDRASLIFTLVSGYFSPAISTGSRYEQIRGYSPSIVYNLAFNQHQIIDHTAGRYQIYPPYIYVSQQEPSPLEQVLNRVTATNCDDLIMTYGISTPEKISHLSYSQKVQFLQEELSMYHRVFTRPKNMVLPPDLNQRSEAEIHQILSYYTNLELIQHYEPRGEFENRNQLLRCIVDDLLGIPKWSVSSIRHCTNDATMNVVTGEIHGEIDKSDPTDPTLSYGHHKNYTCYQASELAASFREYDGVFQFQIPDYLPPAPGAPRIPNTFSTESIKQLHRVMISNPAGGELVAAIEVGLRAMKSARAQTQRFKQEFATFSNAQQEQIRQYLAWMFMYAMWMRFWKGPGHPWAMKKVRVESAMSRSLGKRASPEERDEHIWIQDGIRTRILEALEPDAFIYSWVTALPAVHYDFDTGDSHCASYTIHEKMNTIALGNECMGFGSDIILKTGYYYIQFLLEIEEGSNFDRFIYHQMPAVIAMERDVITTQMTTLIGSDNPQRMAVMHSRLQAIDTPLTNQPPFDASLYQTNVHVN